MAVSSEEQRRGVGSKLVNHLECVVRALGVSSVALHARQDARTFYEKLGYAIASEPYLEVGIPHVGMVKDLSSVRFGSPT